MAEFVTTALDKGSDPDAQTIGDPPIEPGFLLDTKKSDDKKTAETIAKMWESQNDLLSEQLSQWEVNRLRRRGVKGVRVIRDTHSGFRAWASPRLENEPDLIPTINKADDLIRKLVSQIYADPPAPEPEPMTGSDEDIDSAEVSRRALIDIQSENNNGTIKHLRMATGRAGTYGSTFLHFFIDPTGGGRQRVQVSAGFTPSIESPEDGQPTPKVEAQTIDEATEQSPGIPWHSYTTRWVKEDGDLTDDPSEAAEQNVEVLDEEILTAPMVRFFPHDCIDLWDAKGVIIGRPVTWGEARNRWPELNEMKDEEVSEIIGWSPESVSLVLGKKGMKTFDHDHENRDDQQIWMFTVYFVGGNDYPHGARAISIANVKTLVREEWCHEDDRGQKICLDIPMTQARIFDGDSPYGMAPMTLIGPGEEVRSDIMAAWQDHLQELIHRKQFMVASANITVADMKNRAKKFIFINRAEGRPILQDVAPFPGDATNMYGTQGREMEEALAQSAITQGLESPQVQSGRHAAQIRAQGQANQSDPREFSISAYLRACSVQLQMIRAFYTTTRRIMWVGDDGAYKERRFSGSDLGPIRDIRLQNGSFTGLSPIAKIQFAQQIASFGGLDPFDLVDIMTSNLSPVLGIKDDPHRNRVRRQIATWYEGPPEDWEPAFQPQPRFGPPTVDPATGQQAQGQPVLDENGEQVIDQIQVMDETLATIWDPIDADTFPQVALIRARELAKAQARSEYMNKPVNWRWGFSFMVQQAAQFASPQGTQPGEQPQTRSPAQATQGPESQPRPDLPSPAGQIADAV